MTTQQPYLRRAELLIGPLAEWKGGGNEKQALRVYADGTQEGLRMSFSVHKHAVSTSSPTIVSIYNLSEKTRTALQEKDIQLILKVGHLNTEMRTLFTGTLLNSVTRRRGADLVTDVITLAGWGAAARSLTSITFAGGTRLQDIVKQLAQKLEGVTVDTKRIKLPNVTIGPQGWSFVGSVSHNLDKLSRVFGFSWWVNDGVFQAKDDIESFTGGKVIISYKDGSLLRAEPILASPMQKQSGTMISSILNPEIQPGNLVGLESGLNKTLNRDYTVHTLAHQGDTHSQQWQSTIQSFIQVQ